MSRSDHQEVQPIPHDLGYDEKTAMIIARWLPWRTCSPAPMIDFLAPTRYFSPLPAGADQRRRADLLRASMLLAALRGYAGCEVLAVSNWLLRRDDQVGCAVFWPIDQLERR